MRLRTKFAIVIVCITLVLSASVYVAVEFYKRDAVGETHETVNETAQLAADQIEESIRDSRDDVGLVASRPGAQNFSQSDQFLNSFLNTSGTRFYAAQVVAANGTVVSFQGDIDKQQRQAVVGSKRSNVPHVSQVLEGKSFIGGLEYDNQTDSHILVFSTPILNGTAVKNGTDVGNGTGIKGVLVAAMKLNEQTVFNMLRPLENTSHTVTVVGDGMELHATNQTFTASVQGSATVGLTDWRVTVARDRSSLDARLNQLALFQGGELGLVILLMLGLGYWQYAANLRQTERLLDGFDELGAGNYDHSVSLRGGTEWEQMSDGFNNLATTLQAREAALRERKQRLQVMYRVLRHNLRNEMSVILTYADLITDLTTDEQIVDAAATIGDAGRDLTNLSDRARQIENAIEPDVDRRPIDVANLVSEVVDDVDEQYVSVDVTASMPEEAWALALPSLRLAVENICENACEHNDSPDPQVEIDVTVASQHDHDEGAGEASAEVRISVVDNGPGIPDQEKEAIRTGRETALEHGSGLGLWLTYWIVKNSGGTLTFSDNDPRGTVVDILLQQGVPSDKDERRDSQDATRPQKLPE